MVAAAGFTDSTPRGPAINALRLSGDRCQACQQHPQGGRHQRFLITKWWPLPDPPTAPFMGPPSTSCNKVVAVASLLATSPRGHCGKHYHYGVRYEQDISA
jgi:hypothetical protein